MSYLIHITAYSPHKGKRVDLWYKSILEAATKNPQLVDFKKTGYYKYIPEDSKKNKKLTSFV